MLSTQRCTSRAYWRVDMWGLARSRLGKRYREPVTRSIGNQASTELLDCSVISNWTGRPVFFWTIVARCRTFTPEQTSSNRSLTRSQARSLLSIARLKITRSRLDHAISRRTRMDQTCFGSRGFFWPMSNPLFQGCWPRLTGRTGIGGPPPPRPPLRSIASVIFIPTEQSGSPKKVLATDHFWRKAAVRTQAVALDHRRYPQQLQSTASHPHSLSLARSNKYRAYREVRLIVEEHSREAMPV